MDASKYHLYKNEAEYNMLVFGSVHVGAEFIGSGPERFFNVVDHEVVNGHKVNQRLGFSGLKVLALL